MIDIVIFSTISKDHAISCGRRLGSVLKNSNVHIFCNMRDEIEFFDRIKKSCKSDVLYIDEFCDIDEGFIKKIESIEKTSLLEFSVGKEIFLRMGAYFEKEYFDSIGAQEFFSIVCGNQEIIEKNNIDVIENVGSYFSFGGGDWCFFLANRMKYLISKYGDKSDISDLDKIVSNDYFKYAPYHKLENFNVINPDLAALVAKNLKISNTNINTEGVICSGKGLIIIFAYDLEDCFGIRRFARSIYNQTYSNYEIVCFGRQKDVKEMSDYILDSVMFKVWDETQYAFINKKIKENKYDWYFVADPYCEYEPRTLELCMLQNKKAVYMCSQPYDVEVLRPCGLPAVDSSSMFFKKELFEDLGYFDPINKFGALEYLNRMGSVGYSGYTIMPLVLSKNINITLNFSIDKFKTQRDIYFESMNKGYEIGPGYAGVSFLMDCPLSLKKSVFDVEEGEINVHTLFLRTLGSDGRLAHMKQEFSRFKITNFELWKNTKKEEMVIEEIFSKNKELQDSCYRCGGKDCEHTKEDGLRPITRGQIANFYSTIKLFEKIRDIECSDEELFMICEDDVVFAPNFVSQVNMMLKKDEVRSNLKEPLLIKIGWGDMLEYRRDHYIDSPEKYKFVENIQRFSNPTFVLNKHAVRFYLDNFEKYDKACDQWVHVEMGMKIKNYAIFPALAKELSHVGLIESDMHPKASHYEWQQLQYLKTGNIEHLNRAIKLKKEYDDFWGYKDEKNDA